MIQVSMRPVLIDCDGKMVEHNAVLVTVGYEPTIGGAAMKMQAAMLKGGSTQYDHFASPHEMQPLPDKATRETLETIRAAIISRIGPRWKAVDFFIRSLGSEPL